MTGGGGTPNERTNDELPICFIPVTWLAATAVSYTFPFLVYKRDGMVYMARASTHEPRPPADKS